jgi:hypothetical protein
MLMPPENSRAGKPAVVIKGKPHLSFKCGERGHPNFPGDTLGSFLEFKFSLFGYSP